MPLVCVGQNLGIGKTAELVADGVEVVLHLGGELVVDQLAEVVDRAVQPELARRAVLAVAERAPGLSRLIKARIEGQLTGGVSAGRR